MSKTIVERIIEESKARVACREALDHLSAERSSTEDHSLRSKPGVPSELVFIEAFLNRFSSEVIPMISRAVSFELASVLRSILDQQGGGRQSSGAAARSAPPGGAQEDSQTAPRPLTGPKLSSFGPASRQDDDCDIDTDLEIPLDEIKEQLLKVLSDPEPKGGVEATSLIDEAAALAEERLTQAIREGGGAAGAAGAEGDAGIIQAAAGTPDAIGPAAEALHRALSEREEDSELEPENEAGGESGTAGEALSIADIRTARIRPAEIIEPGPDPAPPTSSLQVKTQLIKVQVREPVVTVERPEDGGWSAPEPAADPAAAGREAPQDGALTPAEAELLERLEAEIRPAERREAETAIPESEGEAEESELQLGLADDAGAPDQPPSRGEPEAARGSGGAGGGGREPRAARTASAADLETSLESLTRALDSGQERVIRKLEEVIVRIAGQFDTLLQRIDKAVEKVGGE